MKKCMCLVVLIVILGLPRCGVREPETAGRLKDEKAPADSTSAMPVPDIIDKSVTEAPTSTGLVDRILEIMNWGNIVFNTPRTMRLNEDQLIELIMAQKLSTAELQHQLSSQQDIDSARVKISNRMQATLSGPEEYFAITKVTPEIQAVSAVGTTVWKWNVSARKAGRHYLHLVLSAIVEVDGNPTPIVVITYDRYLEIKVTVFQRMLAFAAGNWQWFWAAILVPLAAWLWKVYRSRKKNLQANHL